MPSTKPSVMVRLRPLIFLLALLFAVAGCSQGPPQDHIVLWTAFEGSELQSLREQVARFEQESSHKVSVLKVPFAGLQRKVLVAGPAQQGPDILIGPHDWIGLLQTADLLAPIPASVVKPADPDFYEIATEAVSFDNQIYSAPMMMECVVLARNTELCPIKPENLDDLVRLAKVCQETHKGVAGFAYELDNFYFTWGFLAGFGTDFFAPFREKNLDLATLDFSTPAAVEGAQWVADLRLLHKLVPMGMENQTAVDHFLNRKLGMMICGPWNLSDIRKAGIPYALEPLPSGPDHASSPFVGVTGAMLSRYATDKAGVIDLLTFLSSAQTGAAMCESSGRAPTRKDSSALLTERVTDPIISRDLNLFSAAAQAGTPLPNHPAMSAVWAPLEQAFELITTGQSQAEDELKRTTERVRTKIRFMTE